MKTQVVKVGGSLFDLLDLGERIARWRERQENARQVFLFGGGMFVDAIREFEQRFKIDESLSHRLSCEMMGVTCQLATTWLPNVPIVSRVGFIEQTSESVLFDCRQWLVDENPTEASWEATSDSIAAALAQKLGAAELVLLKSLSGSGIQTAGAASSKGFVDLCFPKYIYGIPKITLVNLRSNEKDETIWES